MAAGVSIVGTMLLLLMLAELELCLTFPKVKAVDLSTGRYNMTLDHYFNYTCPAECLCYKVNETSNRPAAWINCTVSHMSNHITTLLRHLSNPLTRYALFTCANRRKQGTDVLPESYLWDGVFQKVTYLKGLVFDHCRFKTLTKHGFKGLSSLKELVIRGAAIDDLDPDLLVYLPQLDILEVSHSRLTHLFPICSIGTLRVLNISDNHFVTMEHAGLHCSNGSVSKLETLDISNNLLTQMPVWLSYSLPALYHLKLANNYITQTEYSPFENLHKLTLLDISNNSFTSFHHKFLKGFSNLLYLDLSLNKVSTLPRGLLTHLSTLQYLHIHGMDLDNKIWIEISTLRQLIFLNISQNEITSIDTGVTKQLSQLEYWFLNNNRITSLPFAAFEFQTKLNTLDISFNEISEIPAQSFRNQHILKHLHLHHCMITTISHEAFSLLKELLTLTLNDNMISFLPPSTFHGLTKITHIDLSNNNLIVIDSETFTKTLQLSYLNISHNTLTDISPLNQLSKLTIVDGSYNRIPYLNPSLLSELRELSTVILSHNEIKNIPIKLFKGCDSLTIIDLSYNSIKVLDETIFASSSRIQSINLSHNEIVDINIVFSGLKGLDTLDLSYNNIDKVLRGQFPHFITHINLRGNRIAFITGHTFKSLNRIRTVDLSENKLTSLNKMDVEIAFNMDHNPVFNLDFNPFVCDCLVGWLKDLSMDKLNNTMTLPKLYLNSGFSCSNPFYNEIQTLQQLTRSEFLCSYTSHCEESCVCCDYACYCKYVCPTSCRCYIGDDYLNVHQVHCSSVNLTSVPLELPEGATYLHLDGNNIQELHRHEFLALKHVEYLYLNSSQITSIHNQTFKGLMSVRVMYLNDNRLTTIYSITFQSLDNLEELYLQNNDIFFIDIQALLVPPFLRIVNLQGNIINSLSFEELGLFSNRSLASRLKTKIYLSGNMWQCDLDFACKFLLFVQTNPDFVEDASYIDCDHSDLARQPRYFFPETSLLIDLQPKYCDGNNSIYGNITWEKLRISSTRTETSALIAACVVILFVIALFIATYINRELLQVLVFTRFGFRVFKTATPFEDRDQPYDAFISYSNRDEEFVIQQLAPHLQNGNTKFRLCVHYQDFPVGVCIAETIVRSVEASKKTIVLLSDNFLDSEWCRFELQTAHQILKERRNRLILILMPNLDLDKLDDVFKVYFKTSTFLKYDDPWFWEKLIFAMPDIQTRHSVVSSSPLPSYRDVEYITRERNLLQQQWMMYPRFHSTRNGGHCEAAHREMYEITPVDYPNAHYHLANCCSHHINSAYHSSGCSENSYHKGSTNGSCCHYEEVGPGSSSFESTPQKQISSLRPPPPLPSIPTEGFIPRQKLITEKC